MSQPSSNPDTPADSAPSAPKRGPGRYYYLPKPVKIVYLLAPVAALALFICHWWSIPIFGSVLAGIPYYYLLFAILGTNVFIGLGASSKLNQESPPWYDYALTLALWCVTIFFLLNANEIAYHNWDTPPNGWILAAATVMGLLGIEGGRRVGGWAYAAMMLLSIIYPLFASSQWLATHLGGIFYGVSFSIPEILRRKCRPDVLPATGWKRKADK
jgi:TRAP-type uncharacterized transport system fused permease subunit